MQPSNQLKGLVESYSKVGTEDYNAIKEFEKTLVNTIGVYMVSEGYSESDVKEFVSTASAGKLVERFEEALESETALPYINEQGNFDTKLQYVEGAVYARLDEGIRTAVSSASKKVWQNPKFHSMARKAAKYGVATGVGSALDDYLTGGKVKKWAGYAGKKTRETLHKIPEPPSNNKKKNEIPTYEEFEYVEEIDEQTVLAKKGGEWVSLDKKTGKTQKVKPTQAAKDRYQLAKDVQRGRESERARVAAGYGYGEGGIAREKIAKEKAAQERSAEANRARQEAAKREAEAKRQEKRRKTTPPAPAPTAAPAPKPAPAKPAPQKQTGDPEKDYATWTKANKALAKKVKPGQAGYDVIQKTLKSMGEETVDEGILRTMKKAAKAVLGPANQSPEAEKARMNKYRPSVRDKDRMRQSGMKEDIEQLIDFLLSEGYADTLEGAFDMLEGMSDEWINEILDICQLEEAMIEYLQVMGEAEDHDEALYILSEMDEEAIDILTDQVEDIMESMASRNRMKELLSNKSNKSAPYGGARSREFEKRLPKPQSQKARSREFEHGSTRSMNTPSGNLVDKSPRDPKTGKLMY